MRQLLIVTFIFLVMASLIIAIDITYPLQGFNTLHSSLSNLSYATSGHTGFMKEGGMATLTFQCNNMNASGSVKVNGTFVFTGRAPNNASFTLNGLSEKEYSTLTNKPTTFAGLGITGLASQTLFSAHVATTTPHGINGIVNPASVTDHIATTTAHVTGTILDYANVVNPELDWPWHFNGANWTLLGEADVFRRYGHTMLNYNNKMWIIGGLGSTTYQNDVWSSSDGLNWTVATYSAAFPTRRNHMSVVYDNKMWVVGGLRPASLNDVWSSTDGVTWTCATTSANFQARHTSNLVVFDNKIWILFGNGSSYFMDAWYSTNGTNWTLATTSITLGIPSAPYIRGCPAAFVHDNKIWIHGGYNGTIQESIINSPDGINWSIATTSSLLGGKWLHSITKYDGKFWSFGGLSTTAGSGLWNSPDGINWTQALITYPYNVRYQGVLAYNGRIYQTGGDLFGAGVASQCYATYLSR